MAHCSMVRRSSATVVRSPLLMFFRRLTVDRASAPVIGPALPQRYDPTPGNATTPPPDIYAVRPMVFALPIRTVEASK
jgi:hypothetical protein